MALALYAMAGLQLAANAVEPAALAAIDESAISKTAADQVAASTAQGSAEHIAAALKVVQNTTADLIKLIEGAQSYVQEDEPRFYKELGGVLHQYIDFESFSRAVMGKYASSKRLANMPPAERNKLETQIKRFNEIFTGALINTYGKGLLVFEGERIEVLQPPAEAGALAKKGKARIKQLIYGDRAEPYVIYYSLRRNAAGEWHIRNMIIESSNLGKIYRNQFDNAYKVYDGDIDRVIDNWVTAADS
ncbi:MAG: ABC transporter substrate-binding protein [Gammaproteobacteria bacterium]|nr:ABC transporter substrate-binding protein [Gammaproteobacteria bacterium]